MGASALSLYTITVLIWGSTWLVITFQLGEVDPLVSVVYRFGLACALLFVWCWLRGLRLAMSVREHGFMALQGSCLFGFNYWLIYSSEQYLASGVVAVTFSFMVFFNVFNARLFLGAKINPRVITGGAFGFSGVMLLFYPEVEALSFGDTAVMGFGLALLATFIASLGNMVATRNSRAGSSILAVNAWSMFYGALIMGLVAVATGVPFTYDYSLSYTASLLYLSIAGSIITFGAYLRLLTLIGPSRAGYTAMIIPLVALLISTVFENYQWTIPAVIGLLLILFGNWQAMKAK